MVDVRDAGEGLVEIEGNSDEMEYFGPEDDNLDELELPVEVKRRIFALKKLQLDVIQLEAEFFKEMHALEKKYLPLYQPLFDKRNLITTGKYEPTDEECSYPGIEELPKQMEAISINPMEKDSAGDNKDIEQPREKIVGVPNFWLKIFENVDTISELCEEHDVEILKHLVDVQVEATDDPMGFKLHFHFSENDWFTNPILTKTYIMKCHVDLEDPFSFEGPEIVKSIGCPIDWKKGKNVTVKVVKKKQKHKQRGSIRTVNKTVNCPSFFQFFSPPEVPENAAEELDEETQMRLTSDFEVGQFIRERIIPRAVLYYTGEAMEEEDEEFEDDDEEEDDDDDESYEGGEDGEDDGFAERGRRRFDTEEEDEEAGGGGRSAKNNKGSRNSNSKTKKANPEDCKNQ